jgi:DNA-binding CsgD family transcriptional regulator
MNDPGKHRRASGDVQSVTVFTTSALRCRTPKQFRQLLTSLKDLLPYHNLVCGWGYPPGSIGFVFNHGFPTEFLRWYLTKGMIRRGPVFQEWLRTKRTEIWLDAAKRLKDQFDPELLERILKFNLQYSLSGGLVSQDLWVHFTVNMGSEEGCQRYLKQFQKLVPLLCRALRQSCPRPLLTAREQAILDRRAMGDLIKQIASAQGISERTVRMHLQRIKKKLYTDDLVNAVVIAVSSGMLDRVWKEWR